MYNFALWLLLAGITMVAIAKIAKRALKTWPIS